jgi:hypothetical protein
MQMSICQLCKDPIWSFICPHCLASAIRAWLPSGMRRAFSEFNRNFFSSFSNSIDLDGLRCLRCKKVRIATTCPFCYIAEAYEWLRERDIKLADTLSRMNPYSSVVSMTPSGIEWKDGIVPITFTEEKETGEGICEQCDEYHEVLTKSDGRWICNDCEDIER